MLWFALSTNEKQQNVPKTNVSPGFSSYNYIATGTV